MEFKAELGNAFRLHSLMMNRSQHTINELLYVLEHHKEFNKEDFNISIQTLNGGWLYIPSLDTFVPTSTRGIWFNDSDIEFEIEECGVRKYNCITIIETDRI